MAKAAPGVLKEVPSIGAASGADARHRQGCADAIAARCAGRRKRARFDGALVFS